MSVPATSIYICSNVRLSPNYEHTIYFDSPDAQLSYFQGKVVKTFPAYTYLRKEWTLKVDIEYPFTHSWNYLFFQDKSATSGNYKYYFYFITKIEYLNEHTVELTLDMDVMQTFLFNIETLPCFVEREHSATDELGDNTVDEGLDLGHYVVQNSHVLGRYVGPDVGYEDYMNELCILCLTTLDLNDKYTSTTVKDEYGNGCTMYRPYLGTKIDGVYSCCGLFAVLLGNWDILKNALMDMDESGQSEGVLSVYMFPKNLVQLETGVEWNVGSAFKRVFGFKKNVTQENIITSPYQMIQEDGSMVTPKNNKLLTYPFSFLYVTNNGGSSATYRYEKFNSMDDVGRKNIVFEFGGSVLPSGGVKIFPRHYDHMTRNYEEGISLTDLPQCAWNHDPYKLWLAQNQNAQKLALTESVIKMGVGVGTMAGGIATGNLIGVGAGVASVYGGVSSVNSLMAQRRDASIQPPQAKGNLSGSINTAMGFNRFTVLEKCIDPQTAKRIDTYFTKFGYKTNRVKKPNVKVRTGFTYTKTVGSNVVGNIPAQYIKQINAIYDNGVTFWVNGDEVGNYTDYLSGSKRNSCW